MEIDPKDPKNPEEASEEMTDTELDEVVGAGEYWSGGDSSGV